MKRFVLIHGSSNHSWNNDWFDVFDSEEVDIDCELYANTTCQQSVYSYHDTPKEAFDAKVRAVKDTKDYRLRQKRERDEEGRERMTQHERGIMYPGRDQTL